MMAVKPNHICKYSKCNNEYYACNVCDHINSWRSMACSKEHYDLYIKEVLAARAKGKTVDVLPERTDMTKEETKEMLNSSIQEAQAKTEEELKDYSEYLKENGLAETIEKVNQDIDTEKSKYTKIRKKSSVK